MKYKPAIVAAFFKSEGLQPFVTEYRFHGTRQWRFDFAFIEEKVALEVDGGCFSFGHHARGAGIRKDHEKQNAAVLAGWKVLRCFPETLCTVETAYMLKRALGTVKISHV